jgi:hypothetical protein
VHLPTETQLIEAGVGPTEAEEQQREDDLRHRQHHDPSPHRVQAAARR